MPIAMDKLIYFVTATGFANMTLPDATMMVIALFLLYPGIAKI